MPMVIAFISGDDHDVDYIVKHLSAAGIPIEKDKDGYLILSREGDTEEALEELQDSIALLSGMCCLELDSRTPLRLNHYATVGADGSQVVHVAVTDEVHARDFIDIEVESDEGSTSVAFPGDRLADLFELATTNQTVGKVLKFLADADYSWVNLYRVYETVRADIGGEKELISRGWFSKKTISSFCHTANSFSAIGREARHGAEPQEPPRHPMTHGEAKALVILLVYEWLEEKKAATSQGGPPNS